MGWFWGGSDDKKSNSSSDNPLNSLDPSLRDFLTKESPIKYSSTNPPSPSQSPSTPPPAPEQPTSAAQPPQEKATEDDSKAPPQSLFKDGRYAHLWSTYVPQAEAESAAKSDAEKINDVLDGYKQRKAQIGRAALENCALEQWDVNECFRNGDWSSRLTLCRAENRKLERCYLMQASFELGAATKDYQKFLKALGYLSTYDRPPEVDEKIQMHADTLYHRMLEQEAAIEAAKAEGLPIPAFTPLLSSSSSTTTPFPTPPPTTTTTKSAETPTPSSLTPEVQAELRKRLDGLDDKERALEEQAIAAELRAGEQVVTHLGSIYQKQEDEKRTRKEQGRETVGDKVSSLFGFR